MEVTVLHSSQLRPCAFGGGDFNWPEPIGGALERLVIGCVGESWYSVLKVTASGPGQRSAGESSQSGCSCDASSMVSFSPTVSAHKAA